MFARPLMFQQRALVPLVTKPQMLFGRSQQPGFGMMRAFSTNTVNIDAAQSAGPVPIKINFVKPVTQIDLLESSLDTVKSAATPCCFYPIAHKKVHNQSWSGTKEKMRYSKWKLNAAAQTIRGKSLVDAKAILGSLDKKGAGFITELLTQIEDQGVKKGYNSEQMFVKTITVGSNILFRKPDIKGRGKTGTIKVPQCSMRITLEEKDAAEFYKMTLKGETPIGVSNIFRRMIYQNKGDFEHIKGASHMLTSNGRRYRRVQFRRLIQSVQKDYRKRGIHMRESKIERNMLEKVGAAFVAKKEVIRQQGLINKQSDRTQHFEKNYKKQ